MIIEHLYGKITRILQFSSLASDTTLAKVQVQLPFRGWCEILGSVFLSTFWSHFVPIYYKIALRSSFTILKNRRFNLPYPFSYIEMWCYIYICEIIFFLNNFNSMIWGSDSIFKNSVFMNYSNNDNNNGYRILNLWSLFHISPNKPMCIITWFALRSSRIIMEARR